MRVAKGEICCPWNKLHRDRGELYSDRPGCREKRIESCRQESVSKENEFQKFVWQKAEVIMSSFLPSYICVYPACTTYLPACTSCGNKYSKIALQWLQPS